jgi:cytochrome d ubiquinol oxidase subunit II
VLLGIYPYLVPWQLSFREAAAAPNAQALLLVGALILQPVILGYTAYAYWVFRGKVRADVGYH